MTNRKILSGFTLGILLSMLVPNHLFAMEEESAFPQVSLVIDAPFTAEFPTTPLIGVYATPYNFSRYLVGITSRHLIAVMPESVLRALGTVYDLKGSAAEVREGLYKHIDSKALQAWLMIWAGLPTTPPYYNAVFHQIVGEWLGKKTLEDFNVNIAAGLFEPQGIQGGDHVIPFNGLGDLNINRHDNGIYLSPDNGRFYPVKGRNAVAFWLVGADKARGRALVSYNFILISAETRKAYMEVVDAARYAGNNAQACAILIEGLQNLEKVVKKEDQEAIAGIIDTLAIFQATQLPAEEKKKRARQAISVSGELMQLEHQLKSFAAALSAGQAR